MELIYYLLFLLLIFLVVMFCIFSAINSLIIKKFITKNRVIIVFLDIVLFMAGVFWSIRSFETKGAHKILNEEKSYKVNGIMNPYGLEGLVFNWKSWANYEGEITKDDIHKMCEVSAYNMSESVSRKIQIEGLGYLNAHKPIDYDHLYQEALQSGDKKTAYELLAEKQNVWLHFPGSEGKFLTFVAALERAQQNSEQKFPWIETEETRRSRLKRMPAKKNALTFSREKFTELRYCLDQLISPSDDNHDEFHYPYVSLPYVEAYRDLDLNKAFIFISQSCLVPPKVVMIFPDKNLYLDVGDIEFRHCAFQTGAYFGDDK